MIFDACIHRVMIISGQLAYPSLPTFVIGCCISEAPQQRVWSIRRVFLSPFNRHTSLLKNNYKASFPLMTNNLYSWWKIRETEINTKETIGGVHGATKQG